MNVASLRPSQVLYSLTGWEEPDLPLHGYSLGYLIRKLPRAIDITHYSHSPWQAKYFGEEVEEAISTRADHPEDAVIKLCIELVKLGIIE